MIVSIFFLISNALTLNALDPNVKSDICPNGWVEAIYMDMGKCIILFIWKRMDFYSAFPLFFPSIPPCIIFFFKF